MKKQINDLLLKMQNGENCIGETANALLILCEVGVTLKEKHKLTIPKTTKDQRVQLNEGYNKSNL